MTGGNDETPATDGVEPGFEEWEQQVVCAPRDHSYLFKAFAVNEETEALGWEEECTKCGALVFVPSWRDRKIAR